MAKGYQKHSRGGSFKRQDFGDLGLRSLKDQQSEIIEALKLQRLRSEQYGSEYAQGLKGVAASEQENKQLISDLEQKAYATRLDAVKVKADREVDAIKGQAKLAGDKADFWLKFSTTYAKEWGKLAQGLRSYADVRYAQEKSKDPKHIEQRNKWYTLQESAFNKADENIYKSTPKILEADTRKENNKLHLSNSWNQFKQEEKFFKDNIENFHSKFKEATDKETYTLKGADMYVRDYITSLGLDPDSPQGRGMINAFTSKVRRELNKSWDLQEADNDERILRAWVEAFEANPDYRNWHKLVQHVRTMYFKDEDGNVQKPVGNQPRNAAESWIKSIELYARYASKGNSIRYNWNDLKKQTVNIPILPADGTGEESTTLFGEKFPLRVEAEILSKWLKAKDDHIKNEKSFIKASTYDEPWSKIMAEVGKLGTEATTLDWSKGGWIESTRKKVYAIGNIQLISDFHDLIGYNDSKHVDFSDHQELMNVALDPSREGSDRALYLINRVPATKIGHYSNIPSIANNIKEYVQSGVFVNDQMKHWATDLVKRKANKNYNIETGGFTPNARLTVQKLEEYRHMVFNNLKKEDFTSAEARMFEAQRLTALEFDKGLPSDETEGSSGTGYFKATVPSEGSEMTVVWDGWDKDDPTMNKVYDFPTMLNMFQTTNTNAPLTDLVTSGKIITRDRATTFVKDIIEGTWDGKIPENVVNFAAMRGWDKKYAMNYILKTLGYNTQVPVDSVDQLKQAGFLFKKDNPPPRHVKELLLWRSYVRELGSFPTAGPASNPDFEEYRNTKIITEQLTRQGTAYQIWDEQAYEAMLGRGEQEWGPKGQPKARRQIRKYKKSRPENQIGSYYGP